MHHIQMCYDMPCSIRRDWMLRCAPTRFDASNALGVTPPYYGVATPRPKRSCLSTSAP